MKEMAAFRTPVLAVACLALLAVPVFHPFGQVWILAAVCAATVYEGARPRVVYAVVAFLLLMEALYGGDIGAVVIAYCLAVPLLLIVRRFIALPEWASRDGWHLGDAVRTVAVSWMMFAVVVALAVFMNDMLYGHGYIVRRLLMLASDRLIAETVLVCCGTCIVLRRLSVPFRREIHFGV